jgi:hypothetical protein
VLISGRASWVDIPVLFSGWVSGVRGSHHTGHVSRLG